MKYQAADLYNDLEYAPPSTLRETAPGLAVALAATAAAAYLSDHYGAPLTLMALLVGLALNFLGSDERLVAGLAFASRTLLRVGIEPVDSEQSAIDSGGAADHRARPIHGQRHRVTHAEHAGNAEGRKFTNAIPRDNRRHRQAWREAVPGGQAQTGGQGLRHGIALCPFRIGESMAPIGPKLSVHQRLDCNRETLG